jgi:phosphatidate phosphatase APP1
MRSTTWTLLLTASVLFSLSKASFASASTPTSGSLSALKHPPKPGLISGFDDVLRQAEVQNLSGAAARIFSKDEGFAGMPALYHALVTIPAPAHSATVTPKFASAFTIVSAISSWYTDSAEEFLKSENYPSFDLRFRNWLIEWSIENFKIREIEEVVSKQSERKFVFIFDNSEPSLAISARIQTQYPGRIAGIYLRQTLEKPPAPGTKAFITALDIAVEEHAAKRMTTKEVNTVAEAILKEKNFDRIIPGFAYCPKSYSPCAKAAYEIQRKCTLVAKKISDACGRRPLLHE